MRNFFSTLLKFHRKLDHLAILVFANKPFSWPLKIPSKHGKTSLYHIKTKKEWLQSFFLYFWQFKVQHQDRPFWPAIAFANWPILLIKYCTKIRMGLIRVPIAILFPICSSTQKCDTFAYYSLCKMFISQPLKIFIFFA